MKRWRGGGGGVRDRKDGKSCGTDEVRANSKGRGQGENGRRSADGNGEGENEKRKRVVRWKE